MAEIANTGKAHLAALLKANIENSDKVALVAFGEGEDWWGAPQAEVVRVNQSDQIPTSRPLDKLKAVVIKSQDGLTTYAKDTDYLVTNAGHIERVNAGSIPTNADIRISYTAIIPDPSQTDTDIVGTVGYVRIFSVDFVELLSETAQQNPVVISAGANDYAVSATPTRHLLVQAVLRDGDAAGTNIKAYGVFIGCEVADGLPAGQIFFTPEQVKKRGALYLTKTRTQIPHGGDVALSTIVVIQI